MNNKMKKWLTVIGCLAICAVLVVLIGQQFKSPKPVDNPHPPQSSDVSKHTACFTVDEETGEILEPPAGTGTLHTPVAEPSESTIRRRSILKT